MEIEGNHVGHAKAKLKCQPCKDACNCLTCCVGYTWGCVQLWTPLSATFLIYWLVYRPDRFHPRTNSAVLAAFDLTNAPGTTPALRYDLAVDLSFPNSHRFAIGYLNVAASVFYNGTRLGPTDDALAKFLQGPKNTTVLHPAFSGVVTVSSGVAAELQRELAEGTLHLRVTVSLTLMYKVLVIKDVSTSTIAGSGSRRQATTRPHSSTARTQSAGVLDAFPICVL